MQHPVSGSPAAFSVLCTPAPVQDLSDSDFGPFSIESCSSLDDAAERLREHAADALLIQLPDGAELADWPALSHAVLDAAVVLVAPTRPQQAVQLLQRGVQDVLADVHDLEAVARALRLAIERKQIEQAARKAFATDLSTGLPNHAQLAEHMAHLLALREREPAPMALIVLRVEGLSRVAELHGAETANVLRRKAAVRLRSGLRASDVVASIGDDAFAVLLAWTDSPKDGERVAAKLANSLGQAYAVAGRELWLKTSVGLALYPEHGREAGALLRRALGQATQAVAGAEGSAGPFDRGSGPAANDER